MSHYAVAVFSDAPYYDAFCKLMDPYDENDESRFIFEPVSQEELDKKWAKFLEQNPSWKYETWLREMYHQQDGVWGEWYNPQGYYDYYSLDGRDYMYEYKPDVLEKIDRGSIPYPKYALKSQLDWMRTDDGVTEQELREEWRKISREGSGYYTGKYYIDRYENEDTYVRQMMYPSVPYAFITPDGKWHAPGRVGWFAASNETAESYDKYVDEWLDFIRNGPDCYVSLVDCHV